MMDRSQIREGMAVYSSDGEKLGKVLSCDASTFTIEKGFFFPKDYIARYDQVASVTGDDVMLSISKAQFADRREGGANDRDAGFVGREETRRTARTTGDDVSMPVVEEELEVVKRDRQAGEVRLRKDVVTETKHIDVPITREEVHVERVPVTDRHEPATERAFQKDSVSMPIHEEEIEIRKRPVVKEEVRLRKERITEQRAADADVRRERVEIEGEDGARLSRHDEDQRDSMRRDDLPPGSSPMRGDDLP